MISLWRLLVGAALECSADWNDISVWCGDYRPLNVACDWNTAFATDTKKTYKHTHAESQSHQSNMHVTSGVALVRQAKGSTGRLVFTARSSNRSSHLIIKFYELACRVRSTRSTQLIRKWLIHAIRCLNHPADALRHELDLNSGELMRWEQRLAVPVPCTFIWHQAHPCLDDLDSTAWVTELQSLFCNPQTL